MADGNTFDKDVLGMSPEELMWEVLDWRASVRMHRNERGHDRCNFSDIELYAKLPEGLPDDITEIFRLSSLEE